MTILTVSTGTVGVFIKDNLMNFNVATGTASILVTGENALVSVWIVSGTVTNVTGSVSVISFDPVCNVQWNPYASGTFGLNSSWQSFNEGFILSGLGKTLGVWYSQDVYLLDTAVGGTPTPNTFYPNTSGTVHFIGYTFTVPMTGYYNISYVNQPFLRPETVIGPSYNLVYDYVFEAHLVGRFYYKQGTCLNGMDGPYPSLDDINIPDVYLVSGSHNTIWYRVYTKLITNQNALGTPLDWGSFVYYFGNFPSPFLSLTINGAL